MALEVSLLSISKRGGSRDGSCSNLPSEARHCLSNSLVYLLGTGLGKGWKEPVLEEILPKDIQEKKCLHSSLSRKLRAL